MYILLEIQAGDEGSPACLTYTYNDLGDAESRFYTMCAAAVLSEVRKHTIIMMNTDGSILDQRTFMH